MAGVSSMVTRHRYSIHRMTTYGLDDYFRFMAGVFKNGIQFFTTTPYLLLTEKTNRAKLLQRTLAYNYSRVPQLFQWCRKSHSIIRAIIVSIYVSIYHIL